MNQRFAILGTARRVMFAGLIGAGALTAPGATAQDLGDPIPYSAILAAPNDLDLNFRYARQKIAAGRLSAAASTLERILILQPEWHQVRLLYGVVLFRLGQASEAETEFAAVPPEALSESDRATLAEFQGLVAREQRQITGIAGLTGGLNYDTNRNNFPLDGRFQVNLPGTGETVITGEDDENADIGQFLLVDGRVNFDTGLQRLSTLSLDAAGLIVNQVEEDDLDALSGLVGLGAVFDADVVDLLPRLAYRQIALDGDNYLSAGEARLRAERQIGTDRRLRGFVEARGGYEDFSGVSADPFASEASGAYFGAAIGATYIPVDRVRLSARYDYILKDADEDFEAFDAHEFRVQAEYVVATGVSLTANAAYTRQEFDAADPFVSATSVQEDDEFAVGLGAVISAGAMLNAAGIDGASGITDNLFLNLGGDYRRVNSNIENFEYDNFRFTISLTKRFVF